MPETATEGVVPAGVQHYYVKFISRVVQPFKHKLNRNRPSRKEISPGMLAPTGIR